MCGCGSVFCGCVTVVCVCMVGVWFVCGWVVGVECFCSVCVVCACGVTSICIDIHFFNVVSFVLYSVIQLQ